MNGYVYPGGDRSLGSSCVALLLYIRNDLADRSVLLVFDDGGGHSSSRRLEARGRRLLEFGHRPNEVSRKIEVRSQEGDDRTRSLILTHDVNYGHDIYNDGHGQGDLALRGCGPARMMSLWNEDLIVLPLGVIKA